MLVSTLITLVLTDTIYSEPFTVIGKVTSTVLGLLVIAFTGYSRVYLGAHSIDQVILGSLLGAWLVLYMHIMFRPYILAWADNVNHACSVGKEIILVLSYVLLGLILVGIATVISIKVIKPVAFDEVFAKHCPNRTLLLNSLNELNFGIYPIALIIGTLCLMIRYPLTSYRVVPETKRNIRGLIIYGCL